MTPFSEHWNRIGIRLVIEDVFDAKIDGYTDNGLTVTLPNDQINRAATVRILEHYGYHPGESVWLSHLNQLCMKFEPTETEQNYDYFHSRR